MDGLLYKSSKLIVPKSLQNAMLDKIHESHLGIVKCKARARDVLFWIGMSGDIKIVSSPVDYMDNIRISTPRNLCCYLIFLTDLGRK